jgi:hypothetical protein
MPRLVKLIGSGIGLASEAIASYKKPSSSSANSGDGNSRIVPPARDDPPPQYVEVQDDHAQELIAKGQAVAIDSKEEHETTENEDDDGPYESDEEHWELDDAQDERLAQTPSKDEPVQDASQVTDAFLKRHPPPTYAESVAAAKLPCPVIIPQRRPRDRKRGFVRAYAPVLADCGIDQAAFLDFLNTFDEASKASQWLSVVNIAASAVGLVPSGIAMGVSMSLQIAAKTAMEVQSRSRFGPLS